MGLSAALHEGTRTLHTEAERSGVMAALLRGRASRDAYVRLLAALHAIYASLEHALDSQAAHPVIGTLVVPEFARRPSLEFDLLVALGAEWRAMAPTHPLAYAYAEHLHTLAAQDPMRLVSHAWLRYLGDLNGGQIVARLVRAAPHARDLATAFYEFRGLRDPRAAAAAWKARLDALPFDGSSCEALVAEACDGFRRHIALFAAIADQDAASPRSVA